MSSPLNLFPDTATISTQGTLCIAGYSLAELAQTYGTPLYIYDYETIRNACMRYWQALHTQYHASDVRLLYASKAYISPLLAHMLVELGLGLDVVSGGELLVAKRAVVPMRHISFHGNNKADAELRLALQLGVGCIVLDNWSELTRVTRMAQEYQVRPRVLLRVAPAVETDTHRYLQTGHSSAKFGFPLSSGEAKAALLHILREDQLDLVGLHAHTGTMLRETRPYEECLQRLFALAHEVYDEVGWWPAEVSPGGGWGIDTPGDVVTPDVSILALKQTFPGPVPTLILEPGRSIIARAGVALYRIGACKPTPGGVNYLFVDGGMADNIRPALYGAIYTALAVEHAAEIPAQTFCISGRYCESGDMLIEQVQLPPMQEEDLLCLPTAGAYCLPMASNYNLVPRPAVILVREQQVQVMERRETYDDILARYL
jgi:diaminopimelate decarboxylase